MSYQTEKGTKEFWTENITEWGDIRTKMRHNLTARAWNDKWNVHILTNMHSPPLKGNFFDKHEKL